MDTGRRLTYMQEQVIKREMDYENKIWHATAVTRVHTTQWRG
jgi:hypothetical protein